MHEYHHLDPLVHREKRRKIQKNYILLFPMTLHQKMCKRYGKNGLFFLRDYVLQRKIFRMKGERGEKQKKHYLNWEQRRKKLKRNCKRIRQQL